jgi:FAD-dependent urate hydroxylase
MRNDTPHSERRVLIAGGGIAGPILASFLRRIGVTPVIYEAQPEPRDEAGAFLNLSPNGLAVLETLGLREQVESLGTPTTSIALFNHRGRKLGENPQRTLLIKRGLLNKALREAAQRDAVRIEFGKRLTDVSRTGAGVIAQFEDGSEAQGDLLIGADGIHSPTRRAIMPDAPRPAYTGVIDSGGFTRLDSVPPPDGVMRMTFGLKGFFGYQKAPSGEIFWFQNLAWRGEPDRGELDAIPAPRWRQTLLDVHRDDHAPITAIIAADEGGVGRWPVYDMPSLPTWHRGPICLIGDAAHAISPHAGQGAALAMEDAIVLAQCLRDVPAVEDAFVAFERLRKDRVDAIVKASRRIGSQKVPANGLMRGIRDLILPFFLKLGVKQAERAYAYRVRWAEPVA